MRKLSRWITSSMEIAEVLRGGDRWKHDKMFVHMKESEKQCPNIVHDLW